jgi:hypothetical protein
MFLKKNKYNILFLLLCIGFFGLVIYSANCKPCKREGFDGSDFIDYYKKDIKVLDNEDYGNSQNKKSKFYDPYASYQILDLYKGRNLTFGKPLGEGIPFVEEDIDAKERKIDELKFLSELKNIDRLSETQFKETKAYKLYPHVLKSNNLEGEQGYNLETISQKEDIGNTLDVKTNQNELTEKQDRFVQGSTFDANKFIEDNSQNMIQRDMVKTDDSSNSVVQI